MRKPKNILDIFNIILKVRKDWELVSEEEKNTWFFIVNRYMSKIYPEKSQLFNDKCIDKVAAMDIWFHFMKNKPYPKHLWSKSKIEKENSEFSEKDIQILSSKNNLKKEDIKLLIKYYPEEIKEELLYYNKIEKNK